MKRKLSVLLALLVALSSLLGCGTAIPKNDVNALTTPGEIEKDITYDEVSDSFRHSLWSFADRTSEAALSEDHQKNVLYSPMSLYYALAMLEAGSDGRTKSELSAFMALPASIDAGSELRKLYALMTKDQEGVSEQIANALWMRHDLVGEKGQQVKQAWLDQLSHDFYASAFAVDFQDPKTAPLMSQWVEEQTKGKIKPDIDLSDPLLLLVLMNTLYYKAQWDMPFDESNTEQDVFDAQGQRIADVFYMQGSFASEVMTNDRFTAAKLRLLEGSIRFVLPAEGVDPLDLLEDKQILSELHQGAWDRVLLDIRLPKFEYKTKTDMLEAMDAIGLTDIVTGSPDFSKMLELDAEVSAISQETFIALDEKGVEAAAYTEVMIRETSALELPEPMVLNLDRPFLYVIEDGAGTPLFVGIVRNPNAK